MVKFKGLRIDFISNLWAHLITFYLSSLLNRCMRYSIRSNNEKLWVHCSSGETVGRFDVRFGMDIHRSVQDQLNGKPTCLFCTHKRPTQAEFDFFVKKAFELWGVSIDKVQIKLDQSN